MEESSGVHGTLLCRYVTGSIRPSKEQAKLLEKTLLDKSSFKSALLQRITKTQGGYLDVHNLIADPEVLRWIAADLAPKFSGLNSDRILTAASSGISLATALSLQLGVPIAYASYSKFAGPGPYFEADLDSSNPSEISTLYLPANLVKKGDHVIIVDDLATSGRTLKGLVTLCEKAICSLSAIFVLVSRSKNWKDKIGTETLGKKGVKLSVYLDLEKR
ncbi:MAG: phosphoribosyltransferase family protein [Nitrososphaerales archaeon]